MTNSDQNSIALENAIVTDPVEAAKAARLRHVSDEVPGLRRKKIGRGFSYRNANGERITEPATLHRIKSLVIPPAWTEVWICPSPDGHIQATGRDEKGRKQYIYHPRWHEIRNETKFNRMILFAEKLPGIRERTDHDLRKRGLPREKVLAAVVRLLESTLIRIGNAEYARRNASFGLTTLRDRHVTISGTVIEFEFSGKSGKQHDVVLHDRRLARVVQQCKDIPGYELFQYLDDDGNRQSIDSGDVNDYLRDITGEDISAKDFRTWGGTVRAVRVLMEMGPTGDEAEAQRNVTAVVKQVAEELGNTPSVCRSYYIHPAVLDCYPTGRMAEIIEQVHSEQPDSPYALDADETVTAAFLRECALSG
ncbi:DNA topoisomerase IB [Aggregatilinea lenta]|uniref:DNA topoisomerase IB n=1 Tax=Aggregatilinea lenta TaxID=913108 RepID=UPI0013C32D9F|nr:DNA topoisomerase IB [Aggregatilinea lenta]